MSKENTLEKVKYNCFSVCLIYKAQCFEQEINAQRSKNMLLNKQRTQN